MKISMNDGFSTNYWQPYLITSFASARYIHSSAVAGSKLFVISGFDSTFTGQTTNYMLDFASSSAWSTKAALADYRLFAAACADGDLSARNYVYLFCGQASTGYTGTVLRYSIAGNSWDNPTNVPGAGSGTTRTRHTVTRVGDWIYIMGGYGSDLGGAIDAKGQVWRWRPSDNTWETKTSFPSSAVRYEHMAAAVGQYIYVCGGIDAANVIYGQLWRYDTVGDTWTTLTSIPSSAVVCMGQMFGGVDKLYLIGGSTTTSAANAIKTVRRYNIYGDTWEIYPSAPSPLAFGSGAVYNGKIYMTGGNNGSAPIANVYTYVAG